ncbi:HD domain-containing phosphohydrolase [Pseudodesulfovibrio sp.]|uniref:HD domain-containing phosphohydrolase n=1 Tax=unclassified Pseudodesulfovibrio TaxID=2661612 RepID=UPI003B00B732
MSKAKIMLVTSDADFAAKAKGELESVVEITCLDNAEDGLAMLASGDQYAVVLSGLNLPGMNGIKFLTTIRRDFPRVMRLMVTGDRSFKTAAGAINAAHISKLLPRPCPPTALKAAVQDAVRKYRQERKSNGDACREVLFGSVRMLVDIMELTHPDAVVRSKRIRGPAQRICTDLKVMSPQLMDMVILLSNIGCVALPSDLLETLESGKRPSKEEMQIYYTHPSIAAHLLGNVPKMERIAEIIGHQNTPASQNPPMGARILKACIDMDQMQLTGATPDKALEFMASRPKVYDADVVKALQRYQDEADQTRCLSLRVSELAPGMVMGKPVVAASGTILLHRGDTLSEASHLRLQTFQDLLQVQEPLCVVAPDQK